MDTIYDLTFEAAERLANAAQEAAENESQNIDNTTDDISFPDVQIDRS